MGRIADINIMKKILLLWYTINKNFGDVLLYETVKNKLEEYGMDTGYVDVGNPCNQIFEIVNQYDFLLFAGGGIIERYIPNVIRYFEEDYKMLKVPYGVVGISVGKFDYTEYEKQLKFWIQNAEFFYTRDEFSAKYLNKICNENRVKASVDVVWANNRICSKGITEQTNRGINVRDIPYPDIQGDIDWDMLKKIIKDNGFHITISDESAQNIKTGLIETEKHKEYSIKQVLEEIETCRIIIAMRYHVILVAAANGIPVIPIAYCQKVRELVQQLELEPYVVEIDEIDQLDEKIKRIEQQQSEEKIKLKEKYLKMKKEAEEVLESICLNILGERDG